MTPVGLAVVVVGSGVGFVVGVDCSVAIDGVTDEVALAEADIETPTLTLSPVDDLPLFDKILSIVFGTELSN